MLPPLPPTEPDVQNYRLPVPHGRASLTVGTTDTPRDSLVDCQFSYPLSFRVRDYEARSPLPCPGSGSLLATPPFPRLGPGESSSPTSSVLCRRYDFPSPHPRSLICFA